MSDFLKEMKVHDVAYVHINKIIVSLSGSPDIEIFMINTIDGESFFASDLIGDYDLSDDYNVGYSFFNVKEYLTADYDEIQFYDYIAKTQLNSVRPFYLSYLEAYKIAKEYNLRITPSSTINEVDLLITDINEELLS